MKSIKVFYMGKPLNQVYPHATKWQVLKWKVSEFFKKLLRLFTIGTLISLAVVAIYTAGQWSEPEHIIAQIVDEYPVLDRIAKCESSNSQIDKKTGQTLLHVNDNKTVDVGKYAINMTYWGKKATELGYNLFTEEGNYKMAKWLYQNKGTEPWSSTSGKCWR